jgi:hypothetical protein
MSLNSYVSCNHCTTQMTATQRLRVPAIRVRRTTFTGAPSYSWPGSHFGAGLSKAEVWFHFACNAAPAIQLGSVGQGTRHQSFSAEET